MAFPIIPILTAIAPTIASALMGSDKSQMFGRAMDVMMKFLDRKTPLTKDELELELRRLDTEKLLKLKELDVDFQKSLLEFHREIGKINAQTNLADAKSGSKFQGWWRPALAWACVGGWVYHIILIQLIQSLLAFSIILGVDPSLVKEVNAAFPQFNIAELSTMLLYLLGYGAFRTYEKKQDLTK